MANETRTQRAPRTPATAAELADARTSQDIALGSDSILGGSGGTLNVDFKMGSLTIVPVEGDEFEVEADYDRGRFELTEELEDLGDGKWRYNVTFEPVARFLGFKNVDNNRVEIRVPKGLLMDLEGEIAMGQSDLELGGLALGAVDLEVSMGDHKVRFSEPTAMAMTSFRLEGRMGETAVWELGNASPVEVDVRHRMGELTLDLEGEWTGDASVVARCRMGECTVNAPEQANLITDTSVTLGDRSVRPGTGEVPEGAPTIRLDLKGSMGEVRVR